VTAPALPAALVAAVENEPELPGDMPEDLRHYSTMDVAQSAVSVTKRNILAALEAAWPAALAGVELAAVASELRLRVALERRAVEVLTRMDGGRVGWRSYECSLCDGTRENDQKPSHDASCPLATPPSPAAEALADLLALPGRWKRDVDDAGVSQDEAGFARGLQTALEDLRTILAKLGGTT
jgi:hypothetical protein